MGKKKVAVKNGGKSAKSSADDSKFVRNVSGKRKAESSSRRLIDEEDVTLDEFVKTRKLDKGKEKISAENKQSKKRTTGPKLMADAMPKRTQRRGEPSADSATDEEMMFRTPPRKKAGVSKGKLFLSDAHKKRWELLKSREFLDDRFVYPKALTFSGIEKLISEMKLEKSVLEMRPYIPEVVREFYANLDACMRDSKSERFHKVFVRGKFYNFSSEVINSVLGRESLANDVECVNFSSHVVDFDEVVGEITGELIYFWPEERAECQSSCLTSKYSVLFALAVRNWLPSTHRATVGRDIAKLLYLIGTKKHVDFGELIYSRVCDYVGNIGTAKRLIYPGLIYQILKTQGIASSSSDSLPCCMGALRPSVKIFDGKHHVVDVERKSADETVKKKAAEATVLSDEDENELVDDGSTTLLKTVVLRNVRKKLERELGKISKHMEFLHGYKRTVESVLQLLPVHDGASSSGGADKEAEVENTDATGNVPKDVPADSTGIVGEGSGLAHMNGAEEVFQAADLAGSDAAATAAGGVSGNVQQDVAGAVADPVAPG